MLPASLKTLIDLLSRLPGLGQRSATRLAFYLISQPTADLNNLAQAIKDLPVKVKHCPRCFNLTSNNDLCLICADKKRQQNLICVVEDILDIIPIERTKQFGGVYHVLGGLISPVDGLTPDKLHIKELIGRIKQFLAQNIQPELILALNPTAEGDTTSLYLEKILKPSNAKITKLSRGLATGSDLEYADETTLINALKYRH
ncbi:MAG TPA: recombination mediator RecR [Candidatus Portnoybacteria bacterium]|nr:recombination mediator RecR [Candidatus Portnoybacteria bacterium]